MLVSLSMDWFNIYGDTSRLLPIVFNKGFITTFYASLATYTLFLLRKKEEKPTGGAAYFVPGAGFFRIAGIVLLFIAGALETDHQFLYYYPAVTINLQYLLLYTFAFTSLLYLINAKRQASASTAGVSVALLVVCLLVYLASIGETDFLLHNLLEKGKYLPHFYAHWTAAALAGLLFYFTVTQVRKTPATSKQLPLVCWLLCAWLIVFVSTESGLLISRLYCTSPDSWHSVNDVFVRTGLPILWGICSFAFMWLGMRYKFRPLRIVSLTLFSITLVKLFVYDIRNIPVGGKIAAFFCLGVLLLVVSFMYQRLKRIIIEDEKKAAQ
jgi:uncharacterized membrane protein